MRPRISPTERTNGRPHDPPVRLSQSVTGRRTGGVESDSHTGGIFNRVTRRPNYKNRQSDSPPPPAPPPLLIACHAASGLRDKGPRKEKRKTMRYKKSRDEFPERRHNAPASARPFFPATTSPCRPPHVSLELVCDVLPIWS